MICHVTSTLSYQCELSEKNQVRDAIRNAMIRDAYEATGRAVQRKVSYTTTRATHWQRVQAWILHVLEKFAYDESLL